MRKTLNDYIVAMFSFDEVYKQYRGIRNCKLLVFFAEMWCMEHKLNFDNVDLNYVVCYNTDIIIIYKENNMEGKFAIEIPYDRRSEYIDIIRQINDMVSCDGLVALAVNNTPYNLKSCLIVEDDKQPEKIAAFIQQNNLRINQEKGLREFLVEAGNRMWSMQNIFPGADNAMIKMQMDMLYNFKEKSELEQVGYIFEESRKAKVFISYSHKDEDIVLQIYNRMKLAGMNIWIDLYAIDVGEIIPQKMLDGIKESDFAVLFLSKDYKESMFAKTELQHLLGAVFLEQKKWYPVKLDDVNVDDIQSGMGNYKYYDFSQNADIDALVYDMKKVFGLD